MKVLKSYLDGAVQVQWQSGAVYLVLDGSLGGGKVAELISGNAKLKLAAVDAVEHWGEAELNDFLAKHEPAVLPIVQVIEGFVNQGLAALG